MQTDSVQSLSKATIVLHWAVGVTIVLLIGGGVYMQENKFYPLYHWHKSFGVLIFLFILYRIYRRFRLGWPPPARDYGRYQRMLAHLVHWVLIVGTVVFPISGMMHSGAGGHGVPFFFFELVPSNYDAAGNAIPYHEGARELGKSIHAITGDIMIWAIALHIMGALKHHLIDKDNTLKRMLGKSPY